MIHLVPCVSPAASLQQEQRTAEYHTGKILQYSLCITTGGRYWYFIAAIGAVLVGPNQPLLLLEESRFSEKDHEDRLDS